MAKGGLLITSLVMAATASAATIATGGLAQTHMTYTTREQIRTSTTFDYTGVGSLFVSTRSTATTGIGGLCSGSLIAGGTVLTAAHCFETSVDDPITSINFYLPSFGDRRTTDSQIFSAIAFGSNPGFTENGITGGNDVALFTITGDTSAYDKYDLYLGDPLRQYTEVGTGTIGGPEGTNVGVTSDYLKRVGRNTYEFLGDQVFSDVSSGVALYDFDDGTLEHDVFGRNLGEVQLGIAGESAASPGDSGGPEFMDGKIASVTSFGITGGIFDGFCGETSTDPYNKIGGTEPTALSSCTNSSVGEIGGNTLVSYNIDYIRGYLAGTVAITSLVPEPSTWTMMIVGMGAVGVGLRRRKRVITRVAYAA